MNNSTVEKHLKKTTIWSNSVSTAVTILTCLGIVYGFYYDTSSTLDSHTSDIKEIKQDVTVIKQDMNNTAVFKGMTEQQQKDFEARMTRMEIKQDKILDVLTTIKYNTQK